MNGPIIQSVLIVEAEIIQIIPDRTHSYSLIINISSFKRILLKKQFFCQKNCSTGV